MFYLILVTTSILLLAGFVFVTQYEAAQGVRFFAARREALDSFVEQAHFVLTHVDFGAFVLEETKHVSTIIGHTIVTLTLRAVRAVERLLTRMVRSLRMRTETTEPPHESAREFVKTLSDFKETLKTSYPGVPEIE
jgi:hypothetical protein